LLRQNSAIFGTAYVCDATTLGGAARVSGNAHISGTSRLDHRAIVSDSARVVASTLLNDVRVTGGAMVMRSHLALEVKAYGNCFISYSTLYGDIEVFDFCQCLNLRSAVRKRAADEPAAHFGGHALLADNCHINQNIRVQDHAVLVRVVLYDPGGDRGERPDIGENMILSYATFHNPVALRDHLTQLRAGGRAAMSGATRPVPPPQQPGVQRPNYLAEIARGGRRIMAIQEGGA
jgi:UDP-3-O-[3-hydroxymyristoyl] glucosamine N-acyltransferase